MSPSIDYQALAHTSSREAFITACPFPFLVSVVGADQLQQGGVNDDDETRNHGKPAELMAPAPSAPQSLVLAVRKVQTVIPGSITLGRSPSNDIVVNDRRISKVHALFQIYDGRIELSDTGSRNGTWVGNERLKPRGAAHRVSFGDILSFGHVAFYFVEAGPCWDRVHAITPSTSA